eukprot:gnl/TRDRNA2_/TRDRNA2_183373_c0_seq1.p1 gnl/TRDRNA2_/TRDRNA2_183373_c0~~gnl/TRDRNA2_/TRDRNA2_183373_c0_seq1.p1  ORF type:complete len:254 (+),score=48.08 gnl/TRDRNA2_/TRDRNA2_183373_c0_seq1:88-849(+)
MGSCVGGNGAAQAFTGVELLKVGEAISSPEKVDQEVQVVGRVAHASSLLESPFGDLQAAALQVKTYVPGGGPGGGAFKWLFSALKCVPFYVVDGTKVILVDTTGPWKVFLQHRRDVHNILRDEQTQDLVSGGDKPGRYDQLKQRPNAMKFWNDYNGGKDPPNLMTPINAPNGFAGFGNRPRGAKEYSLAVGDLVAVVGTLRRTDGGFKLDPGSSGAITNLSRVAKELKTTSASDPPPGFQDRLPEVVQMERKM